MPGKRCCVATHPLSTLNHGYALLDSGGHEKLERFGEKVIIRPSSVAIWNRKGRKEWNTADAHYEPTRGWLFQGAAFSEWPVPCTEAVSLLLRPQDNGQVGLFPDHLSYMGALAETVRVLAQRKREGVRVLNLFAYTGLATFVCARAGAQVTHVDSSKRLLTWAQDNMRHSGIDARRVRWIREDAVAFAEREIRRGNRYDVVLLDPPTFSRVSKRVGWTLEEAFPRLVRICGEILSPDAGVLFFSQHASEFSAEVVRNLLLDIPLFRTWDVTVEPLVLRELDSIRVIPCGSLVKAVGAL